MKRMHFLCLFSILILMAAACSHNHKEGALADNQTSNRDRVVSVSYLKDGIEALYPELIADGSKSEIDEWNQIISSDFNKILKIYAFNPFPEPSPSPKAAIPTILKISYEMKLNNNRYSSIFYQAAFRSPYSAHPTDLIYTTNLDKEKSSRLSLPDIIKLNKDFVKDFKTWKLTTPIEDNKEIEQAIKDYMAGLGDEDLLMGMKAADKIGSGNLLDLYSYLTPDRLGISIGVPNYLGDHIEFEKEYSELKDFFNPDFKVP